MTTLTMFNLSDNAKTVIGNAETDKKNAAQSGVNAVLALSWDNVHHVFRHGDAAKLADVLKANGFKSAVAKFYSEKCASVCAFVQRKALLSVAGMPKSEEKTAAYHAAGAQALNDLGMLKSVASLMAAVKPPKTDEKKDEKTPTIPDCFKPFSEDEKKLFSDVVDYFLNMLAMFAAGIQSATIAQAMAAKVPAAKKPTAKKEKIAA